MGEPLTIGALIVAVIAVIVAVAARRNSGTLPSDSAALADAIARTVRSEVDSALATNSENFLSLAGERLARETEATKGSLTAHELTVKGLLDPLSENISKLDDTLVALNRERSTDKGRFDELATALSTGISTLSDQTKALEGALRSSTTRGSWGEVQLRNVIELAGMERYVDFEEQRAGAGESGSGRPDVTVRLPGDAHLAIDAKVPLTAYLAAQDADTPDEYAIQMANHAKALKGHIKTLAERNYSAGFSAGSPTFVLLFVPGESFLSEAMRSDSGLFEYGVKQRVLLATPMNLLAVLWSIGGTWRDHKMAEHAAEVATNAKELYERVAVVLGHVEATGKSLKGATASYNDMVGSIETRMLVTLRKFRDLDVVQTDLVQLSPIEVTPREISAPEVDLALDAADNE